MDLGVLTEWQAAGKAEPWAFLSGTDAGIAPGNNKPGWRLMPKSAPEVAAMLHAMQTTSGHVALCERDAVGLAMPLWLDISGLNQIRNHPVDDFVIEVESGVRWGDLAVHLARHKQAFGLSYPENEAILHALAEDRPALESGQLPRDRVLKVEIATPDGQLTLSGADVVKNVTGYDLNKLYVSGQHAFGVITSVTLKLGALPDGVTGWRFAAPDASAALQIARVLRDSPLPLRMCELFPVDPKTPAAGWSLYAEVLGDAAVQAESRAVLGTLPLSPPEALDTPGMAALRADLQHWPQNTWILEAVLPTGEVGALLENCSSRKLPMRMRPAAGLLYWALNDPGAGEELLPMIRKHRGFAQWVQTPYFHPETIRRMNLPEAAPVRALLKTLKNTLFTPRLILN